MPASKENLSQGQLTEDEVIVLNTTNTKELLDFFGDYKFIQHSVKDQEEKHVSCFFLKVWINYLFK